MSKRLITVCVGLALSLSHAALAATEKQSFDQYVAGLKKQAQQQGYSDELIHRAFDGIKFHERAVKSDKNQPEKKLTLDGYIPRAVPDWKVAKARKLYKDNYDDLTKIGAIYGVQPRFIVALWGVESNFGALMGNYNVIEALTTLAYEGRRETFFRKQIFDALTIVKEGHIQVENMKGSWAGAMGQCQFMPSSFNAYAADGNNDGKKDIWTTKADVFASAANYLKNVGWNDKYTWGRQVKLPKNFDRTLLGINKNQVKSVTAWQALGVRNLDNSALPKVDLEAWLIQPDDQFGRSYLVYGNYQSLMKWNRSHYFALAVSHLADRIQSG